MYLMRWDGSVHDTYLDPDTHEPRPIRLTDVVREMRGVKGVSLLRLDGTVVATSVGSDVGFIHAPTGRYIVRRKVRPLLACLPCRDGEHATVEYRVCTCCGRRAE